jgi:hypothetical protein
MGMSQQIAYSQNVMKPVQNTADDHKCAVHDDLKLPFINDVIQEKSTQHHNKLGNHSNSILQPPTGTATKKNAKETLASRPN